MASVENVQVYRGQDAPISVQMTPPEDVTGWTIRATVALSKNSPTKMIEKAVAISNPATGTLLVHFVAADIEPLEPSVYYWDVWRIDEGFEVPLVVGDFEVLGDARSPV